MQSKVDGVRFSNVQFAMIQKSLKEIKSKLLRFVNWLNEEEEDICIIGKY